MNDLMNSLPKVELYTVIMCPVKHLQSVEYNPRTIDEDHLNALKVSIQQNPDFFKARPILVNASKGFEGRVIGGNQRLRAAIELGWTSVPAMFVSADTVEKEKVFNLLDNKGAGEWDRPKLKQLVMDLHEASYDLTTIGHPMSEIVDIMGSSFDMEDPKDHSDNKGTTPSNKWVACPSCNHQFKVEKKVVIQAPDTVS